MLRSAFRSSLLCLSLVIVFGAWPQAAVAQLITQHVKGAAGLKAGSQPPPGGYVPLPIVYFYNTDK
jgi:hypothetical protein